MKTTRIELELTDHDIAHLRQVIDWLPLARYAPLICAVLPKLPLTESAGDSTLATGAGAAPKPPLGAAPGFSLHALTPKGARLLPEIERILGMVEVGGES